MPGSVKYPGVGVRLNTCASGALGKSSPWRNAGMVEKSANGSSAKILRRNLDKCISVLEKLRFEVLELAAVSVAQGRPTRDSRISTIMRQQKRNLRYARIHAPTWKSPFDLVEEWREHRSDPSANNEHIWVEEIDNIPKPWSQQLDCFHQDLAR